MIKIEKEIIEETAIRILTSARKGRISFESLISIIAGLTGEQNSKKADILLVQVLPDIIKNYEEYEADETYEWQFHWSGIATGKYPLEKLPDHVRELAKQLYYDKEE